jgi:L-lactate dehydrogenase complex protein LldG
MATNSRDKILARLRQGQRSVDYALPPAAHRPMVPRGDLLPEALYGRFVAAARAAACIVHEVDGRQAAIETILTLVHEGETISSWELQHIPVPGLAEAFGRYRIRCVGQDAAARLGLTGADAALAATGSIVLQSGSGRYRAASLLPPIHIAVVTSDQIMPDLESWWAAQEVAGLERTRRHSNIVVITGPSRTADIAMQLVMGMHGPRELHLILLSQS